MATFDETFRSLADTLVPVFGGSKKSTLKRRVNGVFDPNTNTFGTATSNTYSVSTAPLQEYKEDKIDGTAIKRGDAFTFVSAKEIEAGPGSINAEDFSITIGGVDWNIVFVTPIQSGEQNAMYQLQLRK